MAGESESKPEELNMTPMIDVVFLLIIFFMLVSEIAKLDTAKLTLPYAPMADDKPDETDTSRLITINVQHNGPILGTVLIHGKKYDKDENLKDYISRKAYLAKFEPDEQHASKLRVRIRADREARTKAIQRIFDACQANKVYKTEVTASKSHKSNLDPMEFKVGENN